MKGLVVFLLQEMNHARVSLTPPSLVITPVSFTANGEDELETWQGGTLFSMLYPFKKQNIRCTISNIERVFESLLWPLHISYLWHPWKYKYSNKFSLRDSLVVITLEKFVTTMLALHQIACVWPHKVFWGHTVYLYRGLDTLLVWDWPKGYAFRDQVHNSVLFSSLSEYTSRLTIRSRTHVEGGQYVHCHSLF